jgi:hypothetical protein
MIPTVKRFSIQLLASKASFSRIDSPLEYLIRAVATSPDFSKSRKDSMARNNPHCPKISCGIARAKMMNEMIAIPDDPT